MAKWSISMPQEMMTSAGIVLAGDDYDPQRPSSIPGASAIVQAVFADFLLRHKAWNEPHVQEYLTANVGERFESMLLEAVEV